MGHVPSALQVFWRSVFKCATLFLVYLSATSLGAYGQVLMQREDVGFLIYSEKT